MKAFFTALLIATFWTLLFGVILYQFENSIFEQFHPSRNIILAFIIAAVTGLIGLFLFIFKDALKVEKAFDNHSKNKD